ncbi:electron transfer flavoprotein beta subunit lysine methyltransferase-like [Physella acuta]|uniref:electron transfer flavoprotein beta subunit lysine methyltransferase-like n=1 Tax=Physella acuta TaxID=109671 RepID=UPI0027DD4CD4|nr:electron transfer flavoprotein beta subunit lysine methyltransferase-like [Physella acuta]XP_059167307.1 electron transfer flavoprotein beta subunit lysine methyltransferase-like [Physella acuta]XP_059167308.1 electron transfer flavoprotein beta subunit lysine methyltransferase-like [Physella acuta]XP_059167309.1 electron transfer flavoprotein beta subunit lysine methyltransferase-like [Physella acuta]XP_059167310.1 electron transfer flavoprotein beta subunit lysine methyltransferase-like [P
MKTTFLRRLIKQHTKLSRQHLTPEINLNLITPECSLWTANPEECPFQDPFWAFYWPGGQALTRYIFDNPSLFWKKSILDIGSGCGSAALACKLVGATQVVANDIDPVAAVAIQMNMEENSAQISIDTSNLLNSPLKQHFDILLMGDMFYDADFAHSIDAWLCSIDYGYTAFIGDPGRLAFDQHPMKTLLKQVAEYQLTRICQIENKGMSSGKVWMLKPS